ncbi:hypothetical protein [Allokutzneria albata]|uniref:SCO6045-like C-terminal domain-containing protein n=1 Tax=Allokutzneria albata TaxID=211114 RepID=A0A1G9WS44_ALLAB|nr:hypothetical protein [Allokutzneria albata]SDM87267.1 hypothetical protein SAMN04489726_3776 [Allokutzneria albata]
MNPRERVAAAQAELLRALLANGGAPEGFDAERLAVQSKSLLAKRTRVMAAVRPDLAEALGDRFRELFHSYAKENPRPTGVGYRADAESFTTWLHTHGHLPRPRKPRRRWSVFKSREPHP